jgi:hypothetical protein
LPVFYFSSYIINVSGANAGGNGGYIFPAPAVNFRTRYDKCNLCLELSKAFTANPNLCPYAQAFENHVFYPSGILILLAL